jgi:uncharacterized protein (DUF4213/DUF364 family)
MGILAEAAELAAVRLGDDFESTSVDRVVVGLFFTGVKLSTGAGGVCFTPIKTIPEAVCCPSSAGRIFNPLSIGGMNVKEILVALSSREPIKTSVAVATLNALSAMCWDRGLTGEYEIQTGVDAQDVIRTPESVSVAVVGTFPPVLRKLKQRGGRWWVIEQDRTTLKSDELDHFIAAEQSDHVIKETDVLIITGVTLVNHTLDGILDMAKAGAEIAVIGPTASMLPEPLFERGVRIVGGVWVQKTDQLLDVLAAGGSGYHFFDRLAHRIVIEREA